MPNCCRASSKLRKQRSPMQTRGSPSVEFHVGSMRKRSGGAMFAACLRPRAPPTLYVAAADAVSAGDEHFFDERRHRRPLPTTATPSASALSCAPSAFPSSTAYAASLALTVAFSSILSLLLRRLRLINNIAGSSLFNPLRCYSSTILVDQAADVAVRRIANIPWGVYRDLLLGCVLPLLPGRPLYRPTLRSGTRLQPACARSDPTRGRMLGLTLWHPPPSSFPASPRVSRRADLGSLTTKQATAVHGAWRTAMALRCSFIGAAAR